MGAHLRPPSPGRFSSTFACQPGRFLGLPCKVRRVRTTCNASGVCVGGTPTTLATKAVGGWLQVGSCSGSYPRSQFGLFLCPGGKIRGGGDVGNIAELVCGTYAVSPPTYSSCTDELGCFPRIDSTVKDTLTSGGVSDLQDGYQFSMYHLSGSVSVELRWPCPVRAPTAATAAAATEGEARFIPGTLAPRTAPA